MGSIKDYAIQCFREVDRRRGSNRHENFLREYKKLINPNDVGCGISKDCSLNGCYRYYMCDFKRKKLS